MTTVRPIEARDEAAWLRLWKLYLDFYKVTMPPGHSERLFANLLKGAPHFGFVAERDGAVIGFVHGLPHASTWSETGYCYLEDLYVDASVRGSGAGRALIEAVRAEAANRGLTKVYWVTDSGNAQARKLYDKVATLTDFLQYRIG
ncbi:MAG: GNAT family N-acetyltransferase [Parvularculaceae bacterium]